MVQAGEQGVVLQAPLAPNTNHKSTAFGGSLYSIAVLSGWGQVWTLLQTRSIQAHIVIQHSEIDYRIPVNGDIVAECRFESSRQVERFLKVWERHQRARIRLRSHILQDGEVAVEFTGDYVIHI